MSADFAFTIGDHVGKRAGYAFHGTIVARFRPSSGEIRYVVEMDDHHLLHIFNEAQLCLRDPITTIDETAEVRKQLRAEEKLRIHYQERVWRLKAMLRKAAEHLKEKGDLEFAEACEKAALDDILPPDLGPQNTPVVI